LFSLVLGGFSISNRTKIHYHHVMRSDVGGDIKSPVEVYFCPPTADGADAHIHKVYHELRRIAAAYLRGEAAGITLQPTALVHEVFLKLAGSEPTRARTWDTTEQFFHAAASAMRQLLVDHARRKRAVKRGGPGREGQSAAAIRSSLDVDHIADPGACEPDIDAALLGDALSELERFDAHLAKVVEMRFFLGLSNPEVARATGVSLSTVESDWRVARAWLAAWIERRDPKP